MNIGKKKVSNLSTLIVFMHLQKKHLSDFCWQNVSLPCPTALMFLLGQVISIPPALLIITFPDVYIRKSR